MYEFKELLKALGMVTVIPYIIVTVALHAGTMFVPNVIVTSDDKIIYQGSDIFVNILSVGNKSIVKINNKYFPMHTTDIITVDNIKVNTVIK